MRVVRPRRGLIGAPGHAATRVLVRPLTRLKRGGGCRFALLVPESDASAGRDATLEQLLPALTRAAGEPVERLPGGPEPGRRDRLRLANGRVRRGDPLHVADAG